MIHTQFVIRATTVRQQQVWAAAEVHSIMRVVGVRHLGRGVWRVCHLAMSTFGETEFDMTREEIDDTDVENAPKQRFFY